MAGIGKSIEANLLRMGVRSVAQLARQDGDALYRRLGEMEGVRQDPCVLDTFRCAVAQAQDPTVAARATELVVVVQGTQGGTFAGRARIVVVTAA